MFFSAFSFTRLRAQFIKEVLSVLRDPRSRMVVFVPPILQLLVFAFAATLEVRNVDIAVLDQDAGRWSHELVARLDAAGFVADVRQVRGSAANQVSNVSNVVVTAGTGVPTSGLILGDRA